MARSLGSISLNSSGFTAFREFLAVYISSPEFHSLTVDTQSVKSELSGIRYRLHIDGKRIAVARHEGEPDYRADVLATFDKFKEGATKLYRFDQRSLLEMNHVEAAILNLVVQLYPEVFAALDKYTANHLYFFNDTIARFDREVQFYVAYIERLEPLKQAELSFCFPRISNRSKEISGIDVFDLALSSRLVPEQTPVVTNDFFLKDPERVFVVTGPNQGGKTTFARTLGQLHFLASLGRPVPGREAQLFLFDHLFTHFEKEEDVRNLSGKLEDELLRIHDILTSATPNSLLIMNESFLSTTLLDAIFLSKEGMRRIVEIDMICVSVTFLEELASFSESIVSMTSAVNPADPAQRTFKIIRRRADGLAYAAAIAGKHGLTYESVKRRIASNLEGVAT